MIPHLKGREKALEPFGWSPPEAEWVALVCLHSGLFTRAQFCAYFGSAEAPAWRKQAQRFVRSLITRKLAVEETLGGLPTRTRPARLYSKKLYRLLGIPNVRHRRTASPGVLMRRLLSLDYVLDHADQGWLPTEQEKVGALEALKLPKQLFPRRRYHGRGAGQSRFFALKLPIALDDGVATFVYVDPGRDTDTELLSWGADHAKLWAALRHQERQVHVMTVARDYKRQQRAHKILKRWTRTGDGPEFQALSPEEQQTVARIEQAFHSFDDEVLDEYGGLTGAMNYRQQLIDRPVVQPKTPKTLIRIDQGKTYLSQRIPPEEEDW